MLRLAMLISMVVMVVMMTASSVVNADLLLKLNQETLVDQNKYRELHAAQDLVLNEQLVALAQKEAETYALTGVSGSVVYRGATLGKNMAIFTGYRSVTAQSITDLWYNTGKSFNYQINDFQGAGSFTQLVWKGSREFGLGEYRVGSSVYVVALYYPPGNIVGRVHDNVAVPVQVTTF